MYSQEKEQEIHLSYRRRGNVRKKYAGNLNDYNHPNYIHDGRMYDESRLKVKLQLYIYIYLKLPGATSNLASQRHQQLLAMLSNKSKFVIHPTAILIYLIQWYSPQPLCIFSKEIIQTNRWNSNKDFVVLLFCRCLISFSKSSCYFAKELDVTFRKPNFGEDSVQLPHVTANKECSGVGILRCSSSMKKCVHRLFT